MNSYRLYNPLILLFVIWISILAFGRLSYSATPALEADRREFRQVTYRIVKLDPKKVNLQLHWKKDNQTAYGSLADIRESMKSRLPAGEIFLMATNSGIYDQDFRPLGLHVERGVQLRKLNHSRAPGGNFSMVPNGVFLLTSSGAQVVESSEYAKVREKVLEATQSGPLLLHRGRIHPKFQDGSLNRKLRSGVGVSSKGDVIFAISEGFVSFYDFAKFFKDDLDCPSALYLDGSISSLLVGDEPPGPQLEPFVGIWTATTRAGSR